MSTSESGPSQDDPVERLDGVADKRGERLRAAGYGTIGDVANAAVDELLPTVPAHVARTIHEQAQEYTPTERQPSVAKAKEEAQKKPGAMVKTVKDDNGRQRAKVLEKEDEQHLSGATVEVHKG